MVKVYVTSNVVFENESLDIAVVELQTSGGQSLPGPLTLSQNSLLVEQFTFIGHPGGEYKQLNPIDGFVTFPADQKRYAVQLSQRIRGTDGYIGIDNEDRILFNCSFKEGASGSPGIVVVGGIPVVITVLLQGYPDWFYDSTVDRSDKDQLEKTNILEQGVKMERLYKLFHDHVPSNVCEDIFRANVGVPMDDE